MSIQLKRFRGKARSTFGMLSVNGLLPECLTLFFAVWDKGRTGIPHAKDLYDDNQWNFKRHDAKQAMGEDTMLKKHVIEQLTIETVYKDDWIVSVGPQDNRNWPFS